MFRSKSLRPSSSLIGRVAGVASVLALLPLAGCGLLMSMEDQAKLAKACEGEAVEGAGSYQGGADGFMPYERKEASASFEYSVDGVHYKLQRVTKIPEVHTVFCLEEVEEVEEGFCAFETVEGIGLAGVPIVEMGKSEGPTFPRIAKQRKARLVDPSTGKTIAEHVYKMEAPGCDAFIGDPVADNFKAIDPTGISFADWTLAQLGVDG